MSNFASSFVNFDIPNWFDSQHLTGMLRGIEKEGLRVKPDGFLAKPAWAYHRTKSFAKRDTQYAASIACIGVSRHAWRRADVATIYALYVVF